MPAAARRKEGGSEERQKNREKPERRVKHLIRLFSQFFKKIQKQIFLFY